jgi:2-polyprenyl-3-methyl-5-hydroxy-6-metoxy-1,4-benzoquinol methylase
LEKIIDDFIYFYLAELSTKSPKRAAKLRHLLSSHETPSSFFLSDQASTITPLLTFFDEMSMLDDASKIVFDIHGNICWEFLASHLLGRFGWPGDPAALREDTATAIAQRNAARRWMLRHLDAKQYLLLEEITSLQGFSSGGEAIFLQYVWPSLQMFLREEGQCTLLDAGCGAGYCSLVLGANSNVHSILAIDSSAVRVARLGALMKYLTECSYQQLLTVLERCYPLVQSAESATSHRAIDWRELDTSRIRLLSANLETLPVERIGNVDGIICVDVLEHVSNPFATVQSFSKILKRGGRVFLSVPSLFCGLEERLYALTHGQLFPSMLHLNHFSETSLADLFSGLNFSLRELRRFRSPDFSILNGTEGDLVETLTILEPALALEDNKSYARHICAVFEYLG